ncbi:hypothetical protein [Georgenia alba]|uniref:Heparinase II/III-like protein n=1 Tax=Georgenia alba TaxID=2233858 RepID=A0ABW2QBK3_9MICO
MTDPAIPDPLAPTDRTAHTTTADGTVRDWLVSPTWAAPCTDLAEHVNPDGDPWRSDDERAARWVLTNGPDVGPLKERLAAAHPLPTDPPELPEPVEGGPLCWRTDGTDRHATWRRTRTGPDGLLDWSAFCPIPEYRWSLAATVLEVDQAEWRTLEVRTTGPFVLWLDGRVELAGRTVSYMEPEVHTARVRLPSGTTAVHLATWQVAFRECRHVAALRVVGLPVRVVIPSPGADETAASLADAVLERVASRSWAQDSTTATLEAPPGVALRVRVGDGDWQHVRADDRGIAPYRLAPELGEHVVTVRVDDDRCPPHRTFRVAVLPPDSTEEPTGDPATWRRQLLQHVGAGPPGRTGVAGLLARYELDGPGTTVHPADLAAALDRVTGRADCADFDALALLLAVRRVPGSAWPADLAGRVASALTGLKYWITQPGLDAMCYFTENHQLVWHVAELLAGETYPEEVFTVDGRTGAEHAAEAARRAAGWIDRKLAGGFSEFDSNAYLAIDTYALCALIELSAHEPLVVAARTLLDKLLVTLAANSWRGVHGAAHGRSYVHTLRSARFEETSPILRLVAGVGTLNDAVLPATALALARSYRVPDVVRALASDPPENWWGRQVYRGRLAFEADLLSRPYRSDLRVWRTPDVMLSSVQDYRAGLPGLQEHVWGATLGRELQVFVTHPAPGTGNSARPNAWAGHRVLPRVHQHRNALVHVQRFTPTDPVASTHLWLPVAQADEHRQVGDWLAVRRGSGCVAVATPGGVSASRLGETAWQEWLPAEGTGGRGAVWVVAVGGERDGDFAGWVEALAASAPTWHPHGTGDPGVRWQVPGGATLEVTAATAFLVDGAPEGFRDGVPEVEPHLDNPAVRLGFDEATATVRWGAATLDLPIGDARAGLAPLLAE